MGKLEIQWLPVFESLLSRVNERTFGSKSYGSGAMARSSNIALPLAPFVPPLVVIVFITFSLRLSCILLIFG